ncbi:hypothetical protein [Pseudogemmobacter sonorensis]|uniref:hypothetical protein n=1 Tax=Pseudogemmobacter sonorensis TaxID=2989681 RepID=UPI00368072F4
MRHQIDTRNALPSSGSGTAGSADFGTRRFGSGRFAAIAIFAAVYIGTLIMLFGPQDLFRAEPGAMVHLSQ